MLQQEEASIGQGVTPSGVESITSRISCRPTSRPATLFEEPVAQGRLNCAARYDSAGGGIQRPPVMLQPSQQQDWIKDVGDSDSQSEFGIEHLLVAN